MASIGERIREARKSSGLTQRQLAVAAEVDPARVSSWENGRSEPSDYSRDAVADLLGIDLDSFAGAPSFGKWVAQTREAQGLTVHGLARKAGVTKSTIVSIESGVRVRPLKRTRSKIQRALNTTVPRATEESLAVEATVVGMGTLEDFDPHDDNERPTGPGIYVLYDVSDRPIYVGESSNVRNRLRSHGDKFWFKSPIVENASWIQITDTNLRRQIEMLLIKFLKSNAVINKQHVQR